MTVLERIKELCKTKGISITSLELDLDYSNGSLAKAKDIPSSRILEISKYFGVSMDYLMTGEEYDVFSDANAHLIAKIRKDTELSKALFKYFELPTSKKEHVINTINALSEV